MNSWILQEFWRVFFLAHVRRRGRKRWSKAARISDDVPPPGNNTRRGAAYPPPKPSESYRSYSSLKGPQAAVQGPQDSHHRKQDQRGLFLLMVFIHVARSNPPPRRRPQTTGQTRRLPKAIEIRRAETAWSKHSLVTRKPSKSGSPGTSPDKWLNVG